MNPIPEGYFRHKVTGELLPLANTPSFELSLIRWELEFHGRNHPCMKQFFWGWTAPCIRLLIVFGFCVTVFDRYALRKTPSAWVTS